MKIAVFVGLAAVITALILAGVFLNRDHGRGNRVMITLGIRVLLSASLVAFLVISYKMGWVGPGGLR